MVDLWIEVHTRLPRDPKLKRFARALNIKRTQALGMMIELWLWCAVYAQDGDLNAIDRRDIAETMDWPESDVDTLWEALKKPGPKSEEHPKGETGFLDPNGRLHKWEEHRLYFMANQERQDRNREKVRERVRNHREKKKKERKNKDKNGGNGYVTPCNAPNITEQNITKQKGTSSPEKSGAIAELPENKKLSPKGLRALWNAIAEKSLPRVLQMTDGRKRHALARLRENPTREYWNEVIQRMNQSDFCLGVGAHNWVANFDFLLQPDTGTKVLEGAYDNHNGGSPRSQDAKQQSVKDSRARNRERKKCAVCSTKPSVAFAVVCDDCAWCLECDNEKKPSKKPATTLKRHPNKHGAICPEHLKALKVKT